jgi:hypothetical protein
MPRLTECSPTSSAPPVRDPPEPRTNKSTITPARILGQSGKGTARVTLVFALPASRIAGLQPGAAKLRTGEVYMSGQVILYFDDQADALRFALAAGSVMAGDGTRVNGDLMQETARVTRIRLHNAKAEPAKTGSPPERAA